MRLDSGGLAPGIVAGIVLGVAIACWLLAWRRRFPPDFMGRVQADVTLAMLRALMMLLAGLGLGLIVATIRHLPFEQILRPAAIGLVATGGVGFLARAALYLLRIKPELDKVSAPRVAAVPACSAPGAGAPDDEPTP
jgi:hypothetical protein